MLAGNKYFLNANDNYYRLRCKVLREEKGVDVDYC